jgi:hypothetical protein
MEKRELNDGSNILQRNQEEEKQTFELAQTGSLYIQGHNGSQSNDSSCPADACRLETLSSIPSTTKV